MKKVKLQVCPNCKKNYSSKLNQCPHCLYKKPLSFRKALIAISLVFLAFIGLFSYLKPEDKAVIQNEKDIIPPAEENYIQQSVLIDETKLEEIKIRPMSDLSLKTKDEIFKLRENYVKNSKVFHDLKDYKTNPEIYQIEDNIGWISAQEIAKNGIKHNKNITKGDSRSSISVNNPELLVTFLIPDFGDIRDKKYFSKADYFIPREVIYDSKNKTIKVHFDIMEFFKKNPDFKASAMYIDETNARDLGYNYVYCEHKDNVNFTNLKNNISQNIYKMKGFYHKGYSCGLKEGCNNYSPNQPEMVFEIFDEGGMKLKFWKKEPASPLEKADMLYEMYFD